MPPGRTRAPRWPPGGERRRAGAGSRRGRGEGLPAAGWLHRCFPAVSRLALRGYYRFRTAGGGVPRDGPVLLVANHPNSLLDPAAVCAVAGRPVRFLAKAPLFSDPAVGWLMRACGAIPVYRRQDDASLMHRNEEAFRAAHASLAAGACVGIFPEGTSHSEPRLAPLRTGTARIALVAARQLGGPFPIVPVGLVLRHKERFRSRALAVVGRPVRWEDLAGKGPGEGPVRALTARIEDALRDVTINLDRWEDAAVVEAAEAIYAAEFELPRDPRERLQRLRQTSEALVRLRRSRPERLAPLYRQVARYADLLEALRLPPHRVGEEPPRRAVLAWTARQAGFLLVAGPVAALGSLLFFVPYRVTAHLPKRARAEKDVVSTYKLLGGVVVYGGWMLALSFGTAWWRGPLPGLATLPALAVIGAVTLVVRDRWEGVRANVRSYLVLRRRAPLRERLVARRRELAERLEALRRELEATEGPGGAGSGPAPGGPGG